MDVTDVGTKKNSHCCFTRLRIIKMCLIWFDLIWFEVAGGWPCYRPCKELMRGHSLCPPLVSLYTSTGRVLFHVLGYTPDSYMKSNLGAGVLRSYSITSTVIKRDLTPLYVRSGGHVYTATLHATPAKCPPLLACATGHVREWASEQSDFLCRKSGMPMV